MDEPERRYDIFKQNATASFSDKVESIGSPENLRWLLFAGLTFNLLIWMLVIAFPKATSSFFDVIGWSDLLKRILFLTVFFVNFLMFYAMLRLILGDRSPVDIDDGPMKGYAENAAADRRWLIWIVAGMASSLHAILFFAIGIMAGRSVKLVIP